MPINFQPNAPSDSIMQQFQSLCEGMENTPHDPTTRKQGSHDAFIHLEQIKEYQELSEMPIDPQPNDPTNSTMQKYQRGYQGRDNPSHTPTASKQCTPTADQSLVHGNSSMQQQSRYTYATRIMMLQQFLPHCRDYTHGVRSSILLTLIKQTISASFTMHEDLDWIIIHRRLDHISDDTLAKMCTQQLVERLPRTISSQGTDP